MIIGDAKIVPPSACTNCGEPNDRASSVGVESAMPAPGDFSLCIYCGHLMAFADDLTLRNLTDAETVEIAGDHRILAVQRARRALKR